MNDASSGSPWAAIEATGPSGTEQIHCGNNQKYRKQRRSAKIPRRKGSKNLTIEEKIAAAEQRIAELKEQLSAAEAELEGLKSLRDEEKVKELVEAIGASGKSIDDVIAMVKNDDVEPGAE